MAMTVPAKIGRCALWISPVVIVMAAFFSAIPWLKGQNDVVVLGTGAVASIFVMAYALFLSARVNRRMDEVQRAGQHIAQMQGTTIGWVGAVLVMIVPPAMNALVGLAKNISAGSPDKAVILGIAFGVMLVVIMQTLGIVIASLIWKRRVGYR